MTTYNIYVPLTIGLGAIMLMILLVWCMNENPMPADGKESWSSFLEYLKKCPTIPSHTVWATRLLLLTYLVSNTFGQLTGGSVFQQYVSKQFGKTIAKAR